MIAKRRWTVLRQVAAPAATHWSTRTLAAQLGVGPTTIRRVWQRNGLKPHRQGSFRLSRDPRLSTPI